MLVVATVTRPKGGKFTLHVKGLHCNPCDGHALKPVIADFERTPGVEVRRIRFDKGYRGQNYPNKFRVWISGHVRRTTRATAAR